MGLKEILKKEKKKYANEWNIDARYFYENGHYLWMNGFIENSLNVLEIGCGTGFSTLSLLENGHNVISVDENIECLKKTESLLKKKGYKVKVVRREHITKVTKYYYDTTYGKINRKAFEDQTLLIEGDIIQDDKLKKWLQDTKKIDAIICWLIGSHGARRFNSVITDMLIETPQEYRIVTQNKIYELANELLTEDDTLHIVDRVRTPKDEEEIDILRLSHIEQASVTDLDIKDIKFREYDIDIKDGVEMCITEGREVKKTTKNNTSISLFSILSSK